MKILQVMQRTCVILFQVAALGVPYVCMHMRGTPKTMQSDTLTQYANICSDVAIELQSRVAQAVQAGVAAWNIILDPGLSLQVYTRPSTLS